MRILVTGVDTNGRSCAVTDKEAQFGPVGPGVALAMYYGTATSPPPSRPLGNADFVDLALGPGLVRCIVVEYEPGITAPMHHTDTIDCGVVLEGNMEIILDDGAHALHPGDCFVTAGVDHGWQAGPDGCRFVVFAVGTPPPD